jgi:hypothetical protein
VPADNLARLLLSSPVLVDRTLRFPLTVDIPVITSTSTALDAGAVCVEEDTSPSVASVAAASVVASSIGGVGIGVLEADAALEEFRFSLVRLWFDQRPNMDLFKALEPCLATRE